MKEKTNHRDGSSLEEALGQERLRGSKLVEWTRRYLPAEVVATGGAYLASQLTYNLTKNEAYSAIAATHAGNLGYYGTVLLRDVAKEYRNREGNGFHLGKSIGRNAAKMAGEFGSAFLVDTLLTRPAITRYITEKVSGSLGRFTGVALGKIVSDALFYSIVIPTYEAIKKMKKRSLA